MLLHRGCGLRHFVHRAILTYRGDGAWVKGRVEVASGQGQGGHRHGVADNAWSQKGRRSWSGGSRWIPRVGDPLETSEYSLDITIKLIISSTCTEYSTLHTVSMYYSGLVRQVPMIWFASFVHSSNHDPGRHEV
jgi:hypothetical protein